MIINELRIWGFFMCKWLKINQLKVFLKILCKTFGKYKYFSYIYIYQLINNIKTNKSYEHSTINR